MKLDSEMCRAGIKRGGILAGSILLAAALTAIFLAIFAFLLLRIEFSRNVENIGLIVISVLSCFTGGFYCGKKNHTRGFLWGLLVGIIYSMLIMLIRISGGVNLAEMLFRSITTFLYCGASGMLGGMIS